MSILEYNPPSFPHREKNGEDNSIQQRSEHTNKKEEETESFNYIDYIPNEIVLQVCQWIQYSQTLNHSL